LRIRSYKPRRARGLRARLVAAATLVLCLAAGFGIAGPAHASSGIATEEGIDGCGWSTASAQAFYTNTPYWVFGLYIGGSDAGCPVSSSFASSVINQGWKVLPLWVGPQSACYGGGGSKFSNDPATAESQGRSQLGSAYTTLVNWGWDLSNTPIVYDLEAYNTGNSACVAAAKSFIGGWDAQAHIGVPQKAGVYGSTCGSDLTAYASSSVVPDFIDGADWNGNKSTGDLACVPSNYWVNNQRVKQYTGGHNETWNGYTVNVDNDCMNAPAYPSGGYAAEGC
jgi:hypothetical protein